MQHLSVIITEILAGLCWEATRAFRGDEGGRKLRPLHPALGDVIPSKKENPSLTRPTGRGQKPQPIKCRVFTAGAQHPVIKSSYLTERTRLNQSKVTIASGVVTND